MVRPLHEIHPCFQHSIVYRYRHPDHPQVYIGSTTGPIHYREHNHQLCVQKEAMRRVGLLYQRMWDTGPDQWVIELIREVQCNTRAELEAIETEEILKVDEAIRLNVITTSGQPATTPEMRRENVRKTIATKAQSPLRVYAVGTFFVSRRKGNTFVVGQQSSCKRFKGWTYGNRRTEQQALELAKQHAEQLAMAEADVRSG